MTARPPVSKQTLRARIKRTAQRIAHLRVLQAALGKLNAARRSQIPGAPDANAPTVMFDSIDLTQIPASAPAVAGYVAGRWPTYGQLAKRFPNARRLSIAVASTQDADCLDVEPGDATPDKAPAWVKRQHARGVKRPVVYTSVSGAQALIALLTKAGIPRSSYRLWTAHYTFRAHLCGPGCGFGFTGHADATQWTDRALGRNLDESQLTPGFFA